MKQTNWTVCKRAIFSLGAAALLFSACKKSNDATSAGISANIAGKGWQSSTTASIYSGGELALYGFVTSDKSQILITIEDVITVGKADAYENSAIEYIQNDGTTYSSQSAYQSTGSLTLSSWDTAGKKVTGSFTGVFYNVENSDDSVVVSNGSFNCTYTIE